MTALAAVKTVGAKKPAVRFGVVFDVPEARFATLDECVVYAAAILALRPDADVTISTDCT